MSRRCLRAWMLALAFVFSIPFAHGATAVPRGMTAGPCVEGICEYRLDNGLRVLLFPDASKPTVTVNLVYGVGSVHENYGETGMAHLLEHLLFKGTPKHPDIPGEMRQRGVNKNATTSLDRTNYFASFPANDQTLDWLLGLEADRMVNSRIARADLDSEMPVVRNEMEAGENNPAALLMKRLRSAAFDWHNYANMPIGARSDVESVSTERLQAFYRRHYRPDNALLIVAGRIEPDKVLPRIAVHFGPLRKPVQALSVLHTVEPPQDGERVVNVRRPGEVAFLAAAYHVPALAHPDSAALAVLANVLGDTPGGRMHKALVETKVAAFAGASGENLRDPGLFTVIAALPKQGDAAATETELLQQAERIAERPVTAQEVADARQRIANARERLLSDVNAVGMALSEYQAAGDWRLLFVQRDAIEQVTAEDVNRVAATYLQPANRTLGRFLPSEQPERVEIPTAPPVASLVDGYVGRAAVASGEAFEATPQNIQARTRTFTLGEGLKVSLLPKKTRGGTVVVDATFRFGDERAITGRTDAAGWVGPMLMLGSRSMNREQIAARFDALGTQARIGGNAQSASIRLVGKRDTLADALALSADVLRNPAFAPDQFEQLRLQATTGLGFQRTEPGAVAGIAMARHFDPWPQGHPLHVDSIDESLAKIQTMALEAVRDYHRDFYGTAEGEIAIVGDFDPDAVQAQLESLFADWKAPVAFAPIATRHTEVAAVRERLSTPDKPNAVLVARQNLSLNLADPEYPALHIAASILGGDPLKARLADRIRQKEGLSYGVTSALHADQSRQGRDDNGYLVIQAIAAPRDMDKVEAAVREEFARLVREGIAEQELRDAVTAVLTAREQSRAKDEAGADGLTDHLQFGRAMAFEAERDAAYRALTVEAVDAAMRRHFKPENLSVFVAGDFK
jgi:zinc protease